MPINEGFLVYYFAGEKPPSGVYVCKECQSDESAFSVPRSGVELPHCFLCNTRGSSKGRTLWQLVGIPKT